MIRVPLYLETMFYDVPVPCFGTKFPEQGTCPCSRTPAAKVAPDGAPRPDQEAPQLVLGPPPRVRFALVARGSPVRAVSARCWLVYGVPVPHTHTLQADLSNPEGPKE